MDNVINWLLEDATPEVKYRTMTELLGMPKEDPNVKKTRDSLLASDVVKSVMDKFRQNNKWEDINALLALAEMGLTREDVSIDDYLERIFKNINQSSMKCAKVLMLRNMTVLGYDEAPWVQEQIAQAFSVIRTDGTFRCLDKGKKKNDSRLPDMGCYRLSTTYLLLAAELKKKGIELPQFEGLIEFYMSHHVLYHTDSNETFIIQDMARTFFPIDHVHIGLQMILYGLSELGVANHANCDKAWALLHSKKDSAGKYILEETFQNPYFYVGESGVPNKWVTLYCLLAEKRLTRPDKEK